MGRPKKVVETLTSTAVSPKPGIEVVDIPWISPANYPCIKSEWMKEITLALVLAKVNSGKKPDIEVVNEASEAAERIVQRTFFTE